MYLDLAFPVYGGVLPGEHCYLLYGGLSGFIRDFHTEDGRFRFGPINGERGEAGLLRIMSKSRLRVRLPADRIAIVLTLAGQTLAVGKHMIRLGNPPVLPL